MIAIETLAIAIHTNPDIQGVTCGPQAHKCALFADDLLLFVTSPTTSLLNICKLLDNFTRASGLKVSLTKSQILNVNVLSAIAENLKNFFQFEWSDSTILYLGVELPPRVEQLYSVNFPPMYNKLRKGLKGWALHDPG